MSITVDLPEEVYERLEKQAQQQGRTVPEVIARLIEEVEAAHLSAVMEQLSAEGVLPNRPRPRLTRRLISRRFRCKANRCQKPLLRSGADERVLF